MAILLLTKYFFGFFQYFYFVTFCDTMFVTSKKLRQLVQHLRDFNTVMSHNFHMRTRITDKRFENLVILKCNQWKWTCAFYMCFWLFQLNISRFAKCNWVFFLNMRTLVSVEPLKWLLLYFCDYNSKKMILVTSKCFG